MRETIHHSSISSSSEGKVAERAEKIPGFNVRKVVVAGDRGPCGGVNMAVEVTSEVLDIVDGRETVFANHPPVHNKPLMEEFVARGLTIGSGKGPRVLSTHGTDPSLVEDLDINTECPLVTRVRDFAIKIVEQELGKILYFGKPGHPEPDAIIHSVPEEFITFVDMDQAIESIELHGAEKIWVLNQTTLSVMKVNKKVEELRKLHPNANITDAVGICYATDNRQKAVREIFENPEKPVDMLIVVGSKTSHNTQELVRIGAEILGFDRSHSVDGSEDIDSAWFTEDMQIVAATSGASAPKKKEEEVLQWFRNRGSEITYLQGTEKDRTFKKPVQQIEALRRHMDSEYGLAATAV